MFWVIWPLPAKPHFSFFRLFFFFPCKQWVILLVSRWQIPQGMLACVKLNIFGFAISKLCCNPLNGESEQPLNTWPEGPNQKRHSTVLSQPFPNHVIRILLIKFQKLRICISFYLPFLLLPQIYWLLSTVRKAWNLHFRMKDRILTSLMNPVHSASWDFRWSIKQFNIHWLKLFSTLECKCWKNWENP